MKSSTTASAPSRSSREPCRLVSRRGHVFTKWGCSAGRSATASAAVMPFDGESRAPRRRWPQQPLSAARLAVRLRVRCGGGRWGGSPRPAARRAQARPAPPDAAVPTRLLYVDHRAACAFDLLLFGLSVFAGPVYSPRPCSIAQATANAGISRSRKGLGP